MSEAQDGTVEPFGLYDPTKVDKPLAAADVQSLIDASITDKFDAFRAELLQVLKPVTGDRADGADTRAPSTPARGGGTAVTAGSRTAKSTAGDLLGLASLVAQPAPLERPLERPNRSPAVFLCFKSWFSSTKIGHIIRFERSHETRTERRCVLILLC